MVKIHYDYLRSKKAGRLKQLFECEFTENEHLTTWRGTNATILPLRRVTGDQIAFGRGGVVDGNGDYVELSAINDRINYKYEFTDAPYDDSKVVYCGYLIDQWGHFLVETVARLWYFLENDETVDKYIFFIEEGSSRKIKGNYKEFFQLLKLWDKIDIINRPVTYREVIVPELGYDRRSGYSQKYKKIFDTIASNVDIDPTWRTPDKIYFSRSQLAKASGMEFGLEALDDFFATNGYEVIFPEKMPLSQMIFYIRNAGVCATLSGSLPHNMLFAKDGQKTVIVERCVLNNEIQVDVNIMKNLEVTYIDANISLYPVTLSGPFIMAYNSNMRSFAEDNEMKAPNERLYSNKYLKRCFRKYMKAYKKEYGYRWFMDFYYINATDYLWEAYCDGFYQFSEYLSGRKPFLLHHYFSVNYWKQFVKYLVKKWR